MAIYISSDLHFDHKRIHEYVPKRLGSSVEEMNEMLIKNFNSVVKPEDKLYLLGDIVFARKKSLAESMHRTVARLNGEKFLVMGNHDEEFVDMPDYTKHFSWIKDRHLLRLDNKQFIMDHYPHYTWRKAHRGAIMLHGHSHGGIDKANRETTRLDVGVDAEFSNYFPLSIDQILDVMKDREYQPVDHHGKTGKVEL